MQRRTTTVLGLVLAIMVAVVGVVVLATARPQPKHYDCRADRRSLEIGIESYRARFGETAEPTRADLKHEGLIATVDKAYTFVFIDGTPRFRAVTGSGCR